MAAFAIVPLVLVIILLTMWHFKRSSGILDQWARQNGCKLVSSERRYLRRGPFWWRTGRNQEVFKVTVHDAQGRRRSGYVRVGGWFWGMMSDQANVEWTDDGNS